MIERRSSLKADNVDEYHIFRNENDSSYYEEYKIRRIFIRF
jgi:hypothetical protein